jgi:cephalosporin-C deacetylase
MSVKHTFISQLALSCGLVKLVRAFRYQLLIIVMALMTACNYSPFIADFELYNEGVVEDSLLQIAVKIDNPSSRSLDLDIEWRIATDNGETLKRMIFPYSVKADTQLLAYAPLHHFKQCGFYRVEAHIQSKEHSSFLFTNVVMNPEDIISPLRKMADFDAFWKRNFDELATINSKPQIKKIVRDSTSKTDLYEVSLQSIDGLTIRGWLELPKKKGRYPALFRVPGYTETLEPIDMYDDMIVFSLNVRDHGNSDNSGVREYAMWVRGSGNKDDFYYKDIYLDCFVGLNYLASRKDVDVDRIAVWGGSQGGGLSFVTAAFDDRISLCIADIPFLTDWERYFEISHWYELDEWMSLHPDVSWSDILDVYSYFDTKNMADKIECPVWMGIGLQDDVCPPATSFATYNRIESAKRYSIYPDEFHSQPQIHYDTRFKEVRAFFELD